MKDKLKKINDYLWHLDSSVRPKMRASARIVASKQVIDHAEDTAVEQLTNVACLPGVVSPVLGMPDIHWGYGLPMGAVGAFDADEGVISAGCTGFDINCGIHMIRTNLSVSDIKPKLSNLINTLYINVPAGVGSKGKITLSDSQMNGVLLNGALWAVENGYGVEEDLKRMEENGSMEGVDLKAVSGSAKRRGKS
ncbi:MAG: RtcB family protein, partial [Candidatus Hodarchaeota archaeon]